MLYAALKSANDEYASKVRTGSAKENTLLNLAWKVDDLSRLSTDGRSMLIEVASIKDTGCSIISANAARRLTKLHEKLVEFLKGACSVNNNYVHMYNLRRQIKASKS